MIKKVTKAAQIRDYVAANPKAKSADVAKVVGVTPAYVATVMWTATKKAKVAKKKTKVDLRPALKFVEGRAQAQRENWKTIALASSDIPFYADSVTDTTPKRMAQLAYEAGVAKAKLRMQSNIDKIKVGSEVGGLTLTEVGNGKVRLWLLF